MLLAPATSLELRKWRPEGETRPNRVERGIYLASSTSRGTVVLQV